MLVQFSVTNFKSIGEKQVLSLASSTGASRRERISMPSGNSFSPHLLRSAVIFGANASGKSSLVEAVKFFKSFVVNSAKSSSKGDAILVSPNKFINKLKKEPTEFEVTFIVNEKLFQYGFSVTNERVIGEWMFSRSNSPRSKMVLLFQREYEKSTEEDFWYFNESQIRGEKETWKTSTRSNALFLSTAIQLNSEYFEEPFNWMLRHLQVISSPDRLTPTFTAKMISNEKNVRKIQEFVQASGLNISKIKVTERELKFPDHVQELFTTKAKEEMIANMKNEKDFEIEATHFDDKGKEVDLSLSDESDGSQVLFSLAGPILDVLEDGDILFVDELNNSLHPAALKFLVNLFHDPKINKNGAQLVFTSHDASIISNQFMHKSQIWFMDKSNGINSKLYPLSDFKVRDVEAFQRAYLGGKFGALPNIGRLNHVIEE